MRDSLACVCLKVSSVALLLVGCGSGSGKVPDGGHDSDAAADAVQASDTGGAPDAGGGDVPDSGGRTMDAGGGGDVADAGGAMDAPTDVDPASLPPSCLRALFAACPTDTACVRDAGDGGSSIRECYANGVKVERTGYVCSSVVGGGQSTDVMKPDGSLCYHLGHSANTSTACEVEQFVWSDGHTTVATGTLMGGNQALTITCAVGGDSATYYGIASPAAQGWFTTPCTAGACP
jgi:hypothetical protein